MHYGEEQHPLAARLVWSFRILWIAAKSAREEPDPVKYDGQTYRPEKDTGYESKCSWHVVDKKGLTLN